MKQGKQRAPVGPARPGPRHNRSLDVNPVPSLEDHTGHKLATLDHAKGLGIRAGDISWDGSCDPMRHLCIGTENHGTKAGYTTAAFRLMSSDHADVTSMMI